jgi:hypothetical protein
LGAGFFTALFRGAAFFFVFLAAFFFGAAFFFLLVAARSNGEVKPSRISTSSLIRSSLKKIGISQHVAAGRSCDGA